MKLSRLSAAIIRLQRQREILEKAAAYFRRCAMKYA
jgi:hypothetical protein